MDDSPVKPEEHQELAALFALGALNPQEVAALRAYMQQDPSLADDLQALEGVVRMLGYGATPVSPPPALRDRLLTRLQETVTGPPEPAVDVPAGPVPQAPFILRAQEGTWKPTPFPGVFVRTLYVDTTRQYATRLFRLDPGAQVAPHRHFDAEESYVLEGSCTIDADTFQAGDYVRMPAGSVHNTLTSDTGCVLLVMASTRPMSNR